MKPPPRATRARRAAPPAAAPRRHSRLPSDRVGSLVAHDQGPAASRPRRLILSRLAAARRSQPCSRLRCLRPPPSVSKGWARWLAATREHALNDLLEAGTLLIQTHTALRADISKAPRLAAIEERIARSPRSRPDRALCRAPRHGGPRGGNGLCAPAAPAAPTAPPPPLLRSCGSGGATSPTTSPLASTSPVTASSKLASGGAVAAVAATSEVSASSANFDETTDELSFLHALISALSEHTLVNDDLATAIRLQEARHAMGGSSLLHAMGEADDASRPRGAGSTGGYGGGDFATSLSERARRMRGREERRRRQAEDLAKASADAKVSAAREELAEERRRLEAASTMQAAKDAAREEAQAAARTEAEALRDQIREAGAASARLSGELARARRSGEASRRAREQPRSDHAPRGWRSEMEAEVEADMAEIAARHRAEVESADQALKDMHSQVLKLAEKLGEAAPPKPTLASACNSPIGFASPRRRTTPGASPLRSGSGGTGGSAVAFAGCSSAASAAASPLSSAGVRRVSEEVDTAAAQEALRSLREATDALEAEDSEISSRLAAAMVDGEAIARDTAGRVTELRSQHAAASAEFEVERSKLRGEMEAAERRREAMGVELVTARREMSAAKAAADRERSRCSAGGVASWRGAAHASGGRRAAAGGRNGGGRGAAGRGAQGA